MKPTENWWDRKNPDLITIYQETQRICENIAVPVTEKVTWTEDTEQFFSDKSKDGNVIVEPLDTVSSLIKWSKFGKTAILNMASMKRPGGGVANGARAQEECLFRCSNLYHIPQSMYPLQLDDSIYSKDVSFVRDGDYNILDNPVMCDVITIPAINLNTDDGKSLGDKYESYMLDKMFYMLNSALLSGCDNIILGAWVCGVFNNNPEIVAELFKETLEGDIKNYYKNIVFAVINDHNSVANNYEIFKKILG